MAIYLKRSENYKDIEDVIQCYFTYDLSDDISECDDFSLNSFATYRSWSVKLRIIEFNMIKIPNE